jgi:hypothetical protein
MKSLAVALAATLMMSSFSIAEAQGNKTGFSDKSGQGNLDNQNSNAKPGNQGETSVSGPKGQIDKGNTDCNNCSSDLPGANR